MKKSFTNSKSLFHQKLLSFLWRQWAAIGVAGHASNTDDWIIDPEALLLFSSEITRHDPRLFDEIIDWLQLFGSRINLTRLKRIHQQENLGSPSVLAAIGETLSQASIHHKWKSLIQLSTFDPAKGHAEPLFPQSLSFDWEKFKHQTDPHFLKHGWLRTPPEFRKMSQAPQPHTATNLLFKLRALFGNQSRAEIVAWLLSHPHGHPAKITRDTHYSKRIIQQTLNELETSGHIISRRNNREKHFRIIHSQWEFLKPSSGAAPHTFPRWINWPSVFAALSALHHSLSTPGIDDASELFQAAQIRSALEQANLPLDFSTTSHKTGADFIHAVLKDFDTLLTDR